jgi:hypothetical protein
LNFQLTAVHSSKHSKDIVLSSSNYGHFSAGDDSNSPRRFTTNIPALPDSFSQTFVVEPTDKPVPVTLPASDNETDDIGYRQIVQVPALAGDSGDAFSIKAPL